MKKAFLSAAENVPVDTTLNMPGFENARFKRIHINLRQLYEIDDEENPQEKASGSRRLVLFDEVFSKTQRVRVLLRLCALNAAGYDYSAKLLISLNAEQVTLDDSPAYSEEIAQMVMKAIFEAYLSVTENILALSSSYADQIQTLLWRGSDLKSSQQDRADFDSMIQKCLGIQ